MLLFPGQPLSQSGRYSVSMSGELSITDVHLEDSGYYICQAISVAGSVLTKALLEVEVGEFEGWRGILWDEEGHMVLGEEPSKNILILQHTYLYMDGKIAFDSST
jgi:hypothetical protein